MFPFSRDSQEPSETPAARPAAAAHPLDALTGGAFSAPTSGERVRLIREWLASQPGVEQIQQVHKELSAKDKGAAKALRERLDEIKRAQSQQAVAAEWQARAEALLQAPRLNIADALAWKRDAARAGAPLSREPLSSLRSQLDERMKTLEDLHQRALVQREAAALLHQRIDLLSTKPWQDADAALANLQTDLAHWREQTAALQAEPQWASVDMRYPPQIEAAQSQLAALWDAFTAALEQTRAAAQDPAAELPPVPVWADEIRAARGLPVQAAEKPADKPAAPRIDPAQRQAAVQSVQAGVMLLEQAVQAGHSKNMNSAAAALRQTLKKHSRLIDDEALQARVHAALVSAGELQGWQRWSADQLREQLIAQAEALLLREPAPAAEAAATTESAETAETPASEAPATLRPAHSGRKLQEALRKLREEWKTIDQDSAPNQALWQRFDHACNQAHQFVEQWLQKVRQENAAYKAARQALIEEVKTWAAQTLQRAENAAESATEAAAQTAAAEWKTINRQLQQFANRWHKVGGHLPDKVYADLQAQWKAALGAASAPLQAAQQASIERRNALIEQARQLAAAGAALRIDAVRALQQSWQAEAQSVPLDRRQEQTLWDAFRQPLDAAFESKSAQREKAQAAASEHDKAVLQAAQALEQANASGDAAQIRAAMLALEAALRGQPAAAESAPAPAASAGDAPAAAAEPAAEPAAETAAEAASEPAAEPAATPAAAARPARPLVAMRGDDRPGLKKTEAARPGERREGRPGERRRDDRRDDRRDSPRDGRAPRPERARLGDAAYRAQREALDHAQSALRKLAAQAHGEALTQLMTAWQARDPAQIPPASELGALGNAARAAWVQALSAAPAEADAATALLRLEMAAEAPTPAEHLPARRALQLQLLTRRGDPLPAQTWPQDAAQMLATPYSEAQARRLQAALKTLLRKK